ncbi:hypothetical protein [Mesorhizobium sp. M0578]|uniref:hypothetical protein n=1 Tax=unclassified Mesorhizobium TaxID=325217 RepID=UPI00333BEAA7
MLHLEEIDPVGEGITARTSDLPLLHAAAQDPRLDYVELYHGQRQRRHLGQVKLELLADRGPGWFRAVHFDDSLRALDRHISETSGKKLVEERPDARTDQGISACRRTSSLG